MEVTARGSYDALLVSQGINEFCHKLMNTRDMNH